MINSENSIVPLTSFIFKVASRCNLNCSYCYEYNMGDETWKQQPKFPSPQTVEQLAKRVKEHSSKHQVKSVAFSFHGGEPLLAGAKFFRETVKTIRKILGDEIKSSFGVQTNGTLLTREIVDVFSEEEIYIGLSLDGPKPINDKNRIYANNRGSFDKIMRGVEWLATPAGKKVFRGILCVIDKCSDPLEIFDFFASLNPPSIDFLLPHGNWSFPPPGKRNIGSSTEYADWLIPIFDSWFDGKHIEIEIRTFEEIIEYKLGGKGHLETLGLSPVGLIGIAVDGAIEGVDTLKSVYPGAHQLGLSIFRNSFDDALEHQMVKTRQMGLNSLCGICVNCEFVETCGGGYFPHRWSRQNAFFNPSVYCSDYKKLISHIHQRVTHALTT